MSRGFIYILSNPCMPGLYKIGFTARTVQERLRDLSRATGVPTPFKEELSFIVPNAQRAETLLHQKLQEYRISDREFFKTDLDTIKNALLVLKDELEDELDPYMETYMSILEFGWQNQYEEMLDFDYDFYKRMNFDPERSMHIFKKGDMYYYLYGHCKAFSEQQYRTWLENKRNPEV